MVCVVCRYGQVVVAHESGRRRRSACLTRALRAGDISNRTADVSFGAAYGRGGSTSATVGARRGGDAQSLRHGRPLVFRRVSTSRPRFYDATPKLPSRRATRARRLFHLVGGDGCVGGAGWGGGRAWRIFLAAILMVGGLTCGAHLVRPRCCGLQRHRRKAGGGKDPPR